MEKAAKPLKIFISYGHEIDVKDDFGNLIYPNPNNENVVLKIKEYLESRGHEVWLDKEKIQPGADWRKAIYNGIEWSNIALICLSHKSMKPDGVCQDEIAIAMGVRGGNMLHVQLEDLDVTEFPKYLFNPKLFQEALKDPLYSKYLLKRNLFTEFENWSLHCTPENEILDTWLDKTLDNLARELETKDRQQYGVEIVELKKLLNPWNMNSRLRSLDSGVQYLLVNEETKEYKKKYVHKFCGRESLFELFNNIYFKGNNQESERVLWLKKGPGFGKSRFAAELLYKYSFAINAAFFVEYNQEESHKAQTFIRSVAYQLAQANSSYREKLLNYLKENQDSINLQTGDPQKLFQTLVIDLLEKENNEEKSAWILVDALDEATENNYNEIASLISRNLNNLPSWVHFFITSRDNDNAINRNFKDITPIDFENEENVNDILKYIRSEFSALDLSVSEELINILLDKSEGTFLYPKMVFRDLEKKAFTVDDIRDLPKGVIGYIHAQFERLFLDKLESYNTEIRPWLGYVLTSCEPIPRGVLKYALGIQDDSQLESRLKLLGTFFVQSGATDEDTVAPFHKSVSDYCFNKNASYAYFVDPDEAKERFAQTGWKLYKSGALQWTKRTNENPNAVQRYFLYWLPSHLMEANKTEDSSIVLSDFAFLMKRLRYGNVERVLLDYILFRGTLDGISKVSDVYFDVICSNAHYLRRNSEENPAYKTMLQIATEVADDCPVTQAAERWLNPETGDSPCDWFWLNKVKRPKKYQPNPCKLVIENAGNHALLLSNGDALSWGENDNLCIWGLKTRECKAVLEGHTGVSDGAIELHSGDILSWSWDYTLRLWSPDGVCKAILEGHTDRVNGALELRSGDILSWSIDHSLRLWSPDGTCKAVMEGHTDMVNGAIELRSGDILSWSRDHTLRLWFPDGICKVVLEGHKGDVNGAIELRSCDILSWCWDNTLRLWSPDGACKAALEGHTHGINGAIELRSGDILSWSWDNTLRQWSLDGTCKAVLEGHTEWVNGAIELRSGDILSRSWDNTLRQWSLDGTCKTVLEGHTDCVRDAIELRSGDILSWSWDDALRLWSPDGTCKTVLEGHTDKVKDAIELRSDGILSWSDDGALHLWSPNGTCKAVLEGHTNWIMGAIELRSSDILSWSRDNTLRLWSSDGKCKAVLEGHIWSVNYAIELRSGDIFSWSDESLRLWSPDGTCKAILERHTDWVNGAVELRSGDILSWCMFGTLHLWFPDGKCKAVLEGHKMNVNGALELRSGDLLSWSEDKTLRLWSPDGKCKAVLERHTDSVKGALELCSGDILSWSLDNTLCLWFPDGTYKEVIESDNPQYDSYHALFHPKQVRDQFYAKETDLGIELQHDFNTFVQWNRVKCNSCFVGDGRLCVWHGRFVDFLQLNYGKHKSITFEQVHQFLAGEIDESKLVRYDPVPKRGFFSWLFGLLGWK